MAKIHPLIEAFLKGRFSALLIMLVLLFLVGPIVPGDQGLLDKAFGVLNLLVLITCLRAVSRRRGFFIFMLVFTIFNFTLGAVELVVHPDAQGFLSALLFARVIYYGLVFLSIMGYVLDAGKVTTDKICGALSAFFLLGVIWAFIYALFYHYDPTSFSVPEALVSYETINSVWTLYFSITTQTALGYGDITPVSSAAQSYAVLQAATGQIFVAVIIARLVALQINDSRTSTED